MFRDWCRGLAANPKILANLKAKALEDPDFALKVLEYGIGRPPQALSIQAKVEQTVEREILLPEGNPAFAGAEALPN